MKQECLIARLDKSDIAHLYVLELEQNLLNNIRVLCVRQPETLRYFIPEELFWEIGNGEPVAMRAELYDSYGRKQFTIDPLKVLAEQLRDAETVFGGKDGLEIRLQVDGYDLPPVEEVEFLTRPERYRRRPLRGQNTDAAGREAAGGGYGTAYRRQDTRRRADDLQRRAFRRRRSRKKTGLIKGILLSCVILAAAAGVWFMRDTSVKRFAQMLDASNYSEAVAVYNGEILGHESREEKADPFVREAVEMIKDGCLSEKYSYEETNRYLTVLKGIGKEELSELAKSALEETERNEASSATLKEGTALMENREYLKAIEAFLSVEASSTAYESAQENLKRCADLLVKWADDRQTEEDCLEAVKQIEAAGSLLPENKELKACEERCRTKYEDCVRRNAAAQAEQMAADGDYEGAFERIGEAMELLPDDALLQETEEELQRSFVAYVTKEAVRSVDSGDFAAAGECVRKASEVSARSELDALQAEISEAEKKPERKTAEYKAEKTAFTEYPGEFKGKEKKKEFTVTVTESGRCAFVLTKADSGLKVKFLLKGPDGTEVVRQTGMTDKSEVSCVLEKGKTYAAEIEAEEGEGSCTLLLGQQKAAVDVTAFDCIRDSMEYREQCNVYTFVPTVSGIYRFDAEGKEKGFSLKLSISDPVEEKTVSGSPADKEGLSVEMSAGRKYRIEAAQLQKTGEYALLIGKQEAPSDITGKHITAGSLNFTDQKIVYTFTAGDSGRYRITIGNMKEGCRVKLNVYSSLGEKICGADDMGSGDSLQADFTQGRGYQIRLTQQRGTGPYTITMIKE